MMMSAILLFEDKINDESVACLRVIERIAGKECLTKGYAKIQRICACCVKVAEASTAGRVQTAGALTSSAVLYVLQALRFMLQYDMINAGDVKVENLDPKRDGTPGLVHIILGRMFLMEYVRRNIDELRGVPQSESCVKELDGVMKLFVGYPAYDAAFQKPGAEEACAATPDESVDLAETGHGGCDQLDVHLQKFASKPAHVLANFLFDVMAGCLDGTLKAALHGQNACQNNLKDFDFSGKDGMEALRDWKRTLVVYKTIVSVQPSSSSHPTLSAATSGGDGAEEMEKLEERKDVWMRAQSKRKSLVVVGHTKIANKAMAQQFYEKCSTLYTFAAKEKEAHHVFLFSADLYSECRNAPWNSLAPFDETAKPLLEFIIAQAGPADVICCLDGRSKLWRRQLEEMMESKQTRHPAELWIVYAAGEAGEGARSRKCSFASDNREVALLSMPLSRNHLPTKPRSDPCRNAGESSTHDTTYTGVDPMPWARMQMVSLPDKEKIFGYTPKVPKLKSSAATPAYPLYWQEKKTPEFWTTLLSDLGAKAVFDCTPGAGSCGRACMDAGIMYACLAKNQEHTYWLQNVLDRAAVVSICTLESALYSQDLATCIKAHFQDIVDQVTEQDQKQGATGEDADDDFQLADEQ